MYMCVCVCVRQINTCKKWKTHAQPLIFNALAMGKNGGHIAHDHWNIISSKMIVVFDLEFIEKQSKPKCPTST